MQQENRKTIVINVSFVTQLYNQGVRSKHMFILCEFTFINAILFKKK